MQIARWYVFTHLPGNAFLIKTYLVSVNKQFETHRLNGTTNTPTLPIYIYLDINAQSKEKVIMLRQQNVRWICIREYNNSLYTNHKKRRLNMTPSTPEI